MIKSNFKTKAKHQSFFWIPKKYKFQKLCIQKWTHLNYYLQSLLIVQFNTFNVGFDTYLITSFSNFLFKKSRFARTIMSITLFL